MNLEQHTAGAAPVPPDSALLGAMEQGDQEALATFYSRHAKRIYSVAMRVLRDPSAAEDILQEIIMQVWKNPASFSAIQGSLEGWLCVVTRNRAIDVIRGRKPSDPLDGVVLVSRQNVAAEVEESIALQEVRKLVATLPVEQRIPLEMAYFQGLTHSEIAKKTGDPLGTVKTRIRIALHSLRRNMGQQSAAA